MISFFHFALREGGILLLGSAETIGSSKSRFEVISKAERLYRHVGRARPGEPGFLFGAADGARLPVRVPQSQPPSRQIALAEGCRRVILESVRARGGADQPQAGVALFPGTDATLSARAARPSELRSARDGASTPANQA